MSELSEYLKSERLRQGMTLESISQQTRVSVNALQALEAGEFGRIGAPLLIRSFVSSYCSTLSIDPGPLLEKYSAEIQARNWQEEGIQRYGTLSKSFEKKKGTRIFAILILGMALVGALYGGVWISNRQDKLSVSQSINNDGYPQQELPSDLSERAVPPKIPETEERASVPSQPEYPLGVKKEEPKTQPPSVSPSPASSSKPEEVASAEFAAPKPSAADRPVVEGTAEEKPEMPPREVGQKHRLTFEANQETWVQVKADAGKPQSVLLKPGDTREWEASEKVSLVIGNAGGVQLKWDGKPVAIPGKSGSVVRFRLPDPRYLKE